MITFTRTLIYHGIVFLEPAILSFDIIADLIFPKFILEDQG